MDNENYFEQGRKDCQNYYSSPSLAGFTRNVTAENAMGIFWPPVDEQLIMVSMPLPKPRQKWLAGFKKEQIEILSK